MYYNFRDDRGTVPIGGVETMAMPQRDDPPSRCGFLLRAVRYGGQAR